MELGSKSNSGERNYRVREQIELGSKSKDNL